MLLINCFFFFLWLHLDRNFFNSDSRQSSHIEVGLGMLEDVWKGVRYTDTWARTSNLLSKLWNSLSRSWKPSAKAPPVSVQHRYGERMSASSWPPQGWPCCSPVSGMPCARCIRELSTSLAETKKMWSGAWSRSTTFSSSTRKFTQRSVCCFLTLRDIMQTFLPNVSKEPKNSSVIQQACCLAPVLVVIKQRLYFFQALSFHLLLKWYQTIESGVEFHLHPPCTLVH